MLLAEVEERINPNLKGAIAMTNWYYEMTVRHEDLACEIEEIYRRECEERALIDSIIAEVWSEDEMVDFDDIDDDLFDDGEF